MAIEILPQIWLVLGSSMVLGILRASENATSVGGCACSIALTSGRFLYISVWKGSSTEGLCMPIWVPSGFTQIMSLRVSEPLSMPEGVIHMSPLLSIMERLPPDVVVMP